MRKKFESMQFFVVIAISLFILAVPAYFRCTSLSEARFVSFDLSFENPDQKDGSLGNENGWKVFAPAAFFMVFLLGTNLFERICHLFLEAFPLLQKAFVLRC
jgi:hypothetical protein